jgi:hypothetical protein
MLSPQAPQVYELFNIILWHHKDTDATHCVSVDVSLRYPIFYMISYKHCMKRDTPHYVCMYRCLSKLMHILNDFLHTSHTNGHAPV